MTNTPVAVGIAGALLWMATPGLCREGPTSRAGAAGQAARTAARRTPLVELFEAAKPSVVTFTVSRVERRPATPPGKGGAVRHTERGSGFVIHPRGYILTASHALRHGGRCRASFHDGGARPARVIARDDSTDLALVKVDARRPLKPLRLGRSSDLMVGERAIILGNPFGFGLSLGVGFVTGVGRSTKTDFANLTDTIQTDAGLNPGTSGGPLLNIHGEVIGVAASQKRGADGIGFATSIDRVRAVFPEMLSAEMRYGFVLGMKVPCEGGAATVAEVADGSPAKAAGVEAGDVVTGVGSDPIRSGIDFHLALVDRKGGQKLRLKLLRAGKAVEPIVTLGKVEPRAADKVADLAAGVAYTAYEGRWSRLPDFERCKPAESGTMPTFSLGKYDGKDHFALRFTGYVEVPADGLYFFYTASDDGSRLYIGGKLVVDNDGAHPTTEKRGLIRLRAGKHPIEVGFFEGLVDEELTVCYEGPGIRKQPIPAKALFHKQAAKPGPTTKAGAGATPRPGRTIPREAPGSGAEQRSSSRTQAPWET